jgi:hypothetical protein
MLQQRRDRYQPAAATHEPVHEPKQTQAKIIYRCAVYRLMSVAMVVADSTTARINSVLSAATQLFFGNAHPAQLGYFSRQL